MINMNRRKELAKRIESADFYVAAVGDEKGKKVIAEGNVAEILTGLTMGVVDVLTELTKLAGEQVAMQTAETVAKEMVEAIQKAGGKPEGGQEDENDHY
jgi:hypothetical protein